MADIARARPDDLDDLLTMNAEFALTEGHRPEPDRARHGYDEQLKDNGTKYYDEPYLRFKGTKYEQETFFVKDPNENILEIKTLTANSE